MSQLNQLAPGMAEVLSDPRLAELKARPPGRSRAGMILQPKNPPLLGESPFLTFEEDFDEPPVTKVEWVNEPQDAGPMGRGNGFPNLKVRPRFEEARQKPAKGICDAWRYAGWMIASPRFVEILRRFDPQVVVTADIDWVFSDGQKLDGYQFLDVTRLIHAYDYQRSAVIVEVTEERGKYVKGLSYPRALRDDVPRDIHIFREARHPQDIFFSRELAKVLATSGLSQFKFEDPVRVGSVEF